MSGNIKTPGYLFDSAMSGYLLRKARCARWFLAVSMIVAFYGRLAGQSSLQKKFIDDLPRMAQVVPQFNASALMEKLNELPLHHIEGIWQFPATGVEVAVVRREAHSPLETMRVYDMIVVHSPNRMVRPGTVMGVVVPTGSRGKYDARIYTKSIGSRLTLPAKFQISLADDDATFELKPERSRMIFNLWRLLPYLWRYAVYPSRAPAKTDGCVRIFPNPSQPLEPIYF